MALSPEDREMIRRRVEAASKPSREVIERLCALLPPVPPPPQESADDSDAA